MKVKRYTLPQVYKAVVAVIGFVLTVLATALAVGPEVIPAAALPYVNIAIAVGTTYGVFKTPNAPLEP